MLASSQLDLCIGLDIHMEMVPVPPAPVPVPTPFPMPFVGMIEFSPGGLLLSVGIAAAMSAAFSTPPSGPVLVNGMQATKTGDEAQNKKTMPHMVIPPGIAWTPLPKPLKLKMKPGPPPAPDSPAKPPGDAVMVTGSKTVYFEQSNACRLGTLAMSCSDPVRLPSSVLLAIPKGLPVLIGGPPTFDWATAAKAFFLRNKWTAGLLNQLVGLLKPGRLRSLLGWAACQLTGHPVDVATGRLLTRAKDFELRGPIPLTFERFYSSAWAERDSPLGYGWSHTFDERIWLERGKVVYKVGDGREIEFHTYDLPDRRMRAGQEIFYPIDRLTLRCLGGGQWEIRTTDGLTREFGFLPGDSRVSHLTKIRNRLGQWVAFEYDAASLLDGVRSSEGRWARFEHRRGRLHRVALPYPYGDAGGWYDQVSFTYSETGDLVAASDSARRARTYRYENHLLVQETDRDGVSFYFEYDGRDSTASCIRTWGNDGKDSNRLYFREIVYDRKNRRTFVEDSQGHTTTYEMNLANAVTRIIDPHGGTTTLEHNEYLWKVFETNALGDVTRYEYDARGNETRRILPNGGTYQIRYNALDLPEEIVDPTGARTTLAYDTFGRMTVSVTPTAVARIDYGNDRFPRRITLNQRVFELSHDEFGQMRSVTFSNGALEERRYDRRGNVIRLLDRAGRVRRLSYDLESRVVQMTDAGGLVSDMSYSAEGDLVAYRNDNRAIAYGYAGYHKIACVDDGGARVQYRYSAEDDVAAIVNEADETYTLVRDACRRVVEEIGFDGRRHTYVRNAAGLPTIHFLPSKAAQHVEYDVLGNVTRLRHPDGTEEVFAYDAIGRLVGATNEAGALRFERDAAGRVVKEHFGEAWVAKGFDGLGELAEVTTSLGLTERIARSPMGDVMAVGLWESAADGALRAAWGVGFERDATGRETRRLAAGGVMTSWSRDAAGLPVARTTSHGGREIDRVEYTWRGQDQLATMVRDGAQTSFEYDARGRLTCGLGRNGQELRAPGPTGNLHRTREQTDRRYGRGGVLLEMEGTTYGYDADGNLMKKVERDGSTWEYDWNGNGRLAEIRGPNQMRVAFEYDALGRRVTKRAGATITSWLWDGNVPVHETTREGDGPVAVTTWLFEPGAFSPIGKVAPDGKKYSIITDYLGTPTEMYDEAGLLAWRAQLDIYGVPRVDVGKASDCPWRWPGQYADEDTGLYYNRFRYYDTGRGGYLSQDPVRIFGGLSVYGYVQDPLCQTDIWGLTCSSDAEKLRGNMEAAGVKEPPYPNAAHHIVMSNSTDPGMVAARDHLAALGIGKNDAMNGVFLPKGTEAALAAGTSAVPHSTVHGTNYKGAVSDRILSTATKEEAIAALSEFGQMLLGGVRPGG